MLVKTAVFGGDPNWGRILQTTGRPDRLASGADADPGRRCAGLRAWPLGRAGGPQARRGRAPGGGDRDPRRPRKGARRGPALHLRPHLRVHPRQRRLHDLIRSQGLIASRLLSVHVRLRPGQGRIRRRVPGRREPAPRGRSRASEDRPGSAWWGPGSSAKHPPNHTFRVTPAVPGANRVRASSGPGIDLEPAASVATRDFPSNDSTGRNPEARSRWGSCPGRGRALGRIRSGIGRLGAEA